MNTPLRPSVMTSTALYHYDLPKELVAQEPAGRRDRSRLMVVRRAESSISHHRFCDLPEQLDPADCVVLNDSRVVPARLVGTRAATGGRWEGLFLAARSAQRWEIVCQTRGKLQPNERVEVEVPPERRTGAVGAERLILRLVEPTAEGAWIVEPECASPWPELLDRYGRVPLPMYIRRGVEGPGDRERYQTVFACTPGSVAAPTAGLHFTEELLAALHARGVSVLTVTLHVGMGTFKPIAGDVVEEHRMHSETGAVSQEVADAVAQCRASGGRVVAVGSTTVRLLETAARSASGEHASGGQARGEQASGRREPAETPVRTRFGAWQGSTDLYIHPPFEFRAVDALVTNFHLPRSSLLVMVSAFAGRELILCAYDEAVRERYRFYSYGDAMLIL